MSGQKTGVDAKTKYREAVILYSDSGLSMKDICEQTGVGFSAFTSYLSRHHRDLILKRHNLSHLSEVRLRGKKGQSSAAHFKYKEAIEACDSMEYIEYNISQIARIFDVAPSSLAGQLRRHYSDIIPRREHARRMMGITANLQYGPRNSSKEAYAQAVEMLQSSDMTIEEAAETCNVSYTGLREHLTAYYPKVCSQRETRRTEAKGHKSIGMRSGNWSIHKPAQGTVSKYEEAVELYRTTSMDIKEIARISSVSLGGLSYHLRTWHPEMMVSRRGYEGTELKGTKRYKKSTAEKYAAAIDTLRTSELPTASVALKYGLNPETFRMYVKEHHPELAAGRGMIRNADGRTVSRRSAEKYREAIYLYETTAEPLKSIAERLGLTYNSVGGFIRRNCPEAIARHNSIEI